MVGVLDGVVPADVAPHVLPRTSPMASWPVSLNVIIERTDQADFTWDDADVEAVVWDSPDVDTYVWDDPLVAGGFASATCDMIALDVDPGEPDDLGLLPAVEMTLTVANGDGQWSAWSTDGRLVYWALGRRVYVYATHPDYPSATYWVFAGRVATWHENADGTVTITAFDGFAELAQPLTAGEDEWTPGSDLQDGANRVLSIASAAGYVDTITTTVGSVWDVPVKSRPTTNTPLDEMHVTMLSTGGLLMADANGILYLFDRTWRLGRVDQVTIPTVSDNVCTSGVADVWDVELAWEDRHLATYVALDNEDGLRAVASDGSATARQWRLTHPEPDLWVFQADGDVLADYLLRVYSRRGMQLGAFTLHLVPERPRDRDAVATPWSVAMNLRRGDLVRFLHDFTSATGEVGRIDTLHRIDTVAHSITPDSWQARFGASTVIQYTSPEVWDASPYTWDDTHADNVWGF